MNSGEERNYRLRWVLALVLGTAFFFLALGLVALCPKRRLITSLQHIRSTLAFSEPNIVTTTQVRVDAQADWDHAMAGAQHALQIEA